MLENINKRGFTLIELLVVVAIIGLLATVSMVALNKARARARDARRVADINAIRTALEFYYNDKGYYPQFNTLTNCSVEYNNALSALVSNGYMSKIPSDPQFKDVSPRQCYNYLAVGPDTSYGSVSSIYCGDRRRTDFEWSLTFSTESSSFKDFEKDISNNYVYCVHGGLLPGL